MAKTKTESLDKILKEDRRKRAKQSGKGATGKGAVAIPTGPRAAVQKRKAASQPPASLNGKWTHDLHASVNARARNTLGTTTGSKAPIVVSQKVAQKLASNRLFEAIHGGGAAGKETANDLGVNIRGASKPKNTGAGITIKGSAGPFAVHGSNFAPGTTASDIRSTMEKYGLFPINCGILSAQPTVIAEFLFETRADSDRCVEVFNNKLADSRILHFMLKDTPQLPIPGKARSRVQTQAQPVVNAVPTGPKGAGHHIVDGRFGFTAPRNTGSGLYSDEMVTGPKRGRGRNQASTR
ncbi:hypothetical protein TWF730_010676 [Orbilia blumenaviensis]|uniref:Uncharacterized protein n=1 Tax=Orbilia blumenaviensis TaxID=1796055 RepID=A0AAV9URI1_9PEZI